MPALKYSFLDIPFVFHEEPSSHVVIHGVGYTTMSFERLRELLDLGPDGRSEEQEQEFDRLMDQRRREQKASVPHLTCCDAIQEYPVITFSVRIGDGDTSKASGHWRVRVDDRFWNEYEGGHYVEYINGMPEPEYCPFCSSELPKMARKNPPPPNICRVTDGGYYCDTCHERLDGLGVLHVWSLNHVEEDAVQITSSFFAKKPNPTLWWENKPRNSCDYKKRIWFVLWFQVITVSIYAFLRGVLMGLTYLGLLLVGFRPSAFSFRPMFHAFSSMFKQMCDFESKTCNWAFQDANGRDRKTVVAIASRIPLVWIASPILLYLWAGSIYHHPKTWMWAAIILIGFVAAIVGLYFLTELIRSRSKSVPVYYEMVPIEKPTIRHLTPKVRWLDAKGKYCLPFPE